MRAALAALLLAGCVVAGGIRPNITTDPIYYLKNFKLGISEDELIRLGGLPDGETTLSGTRAVYYRMGNYVGVKTYTYLIENGRVSDVIYNDNGPYNGTSARKAQGK